MAFQRFSKWKSLIWQTLPHSVFCWRWSAWPSSCPELIVCVQACGFVLKPVLQDSVTSKRRCLCLSLTHRRDAPAPLGLTQESATVQPDKSWTLASCTWTHTVTQLPLCICVCVSCLTFGQLLLFSIDPSLVSISHPDLMLKKTDCCVYLHVFTLTNLSHYILLCFLTELQTPAVFGLQALNLCCFPCFSLSQILHLYMLS